MLLWKVQMHISWLLHNGDSISLPFPHSFISQNWNFLTFPISWQRFVIEMRQRRYFELATFPSQTFNIYIFKYLHLCNGWRFKNHISGIVLVSRVTWNYIIGFAIILVLNSLKSSTYLKYWIHFSNCYICDKNLKSFDITH